MAVDFRSRAIAVAPSVGLLRMLVAGPKANGPWAASPASKPVLLTTLGFGLNSLLCSFVVVLLPSWMVSSFLIRTAGTFGAKRVFGAPPVVLFGSRSTFILLLLPFWRLFETPEALLAFQTRPLLSNGTPGIRIARRSSRRW